MEKKQSSLAAKLGTKGKQAHEEHKTDETNYGFSNLPPGINGGICQIQGCTHGEFAANIQNKERAGKPYVIFKAVIMMPELFNGLPLRGRQFTIIDALCDEPSKKVGGKDGPPRMFHHNYAALLNDFRLCGLETEGTTFEQLDAMMEHIQTEKPYVRFSTRGYTPPATKERPNPTEQVYPSLEGVVNWQPDGDAIVGAMVDNQTTDSTSVATVEPPVEPFNEFPSDPVDTPFDIAEFKKLIDVASKATVAEDPAVVEMTRLALQSGKTQEDVDNSTSWEEVGEWILEAQSTQTEKESEGAKVWKKDDSCLYKLRDAAGKPVIDPKLKKEKKPVECQIMSIDEKMETVTLKQLSTDALIIDAKTKKPIVVKMTDIERNS